MLFVSVVIVWAMVLGFSPGLSLIAVALATLVLDRYDPTIIDRLLDRARPLGDVDHRHPGT